MKYKAIVADIDDPDGLARIKVDINGFDELNRRTPWCYPCTPFAGSGYGIAFIPQVGDEVYVEQDSDGDWLYAGCFWTGRNPKPATQGTFHQVIRSPQGHTISLIQGEGIAIEASPAYDVKIDGHNITLNGSTGGGVVCKNHTCAYTGGFHPKASGTVKAKW